MPSGLDQSHGVKGGLVSNSPLDLKQFSFIHVAQDLGIILWYIASQFSPIHPTCYFPVQVSPFGWLGILGGVSSTASIYDAIIYSAAQRTFPKPGSNANVTMVILSFFPDCQGTMPLPAQELIHRAVGDVRPLDVLPGQVEIAL